MPLILRMYDMFFSGSRILLLRCYINKQEEYISIVKKYIFKLKYYDIIMKVSCRKILWCKTQTRTNNNNNKNITRIIHIITVSISMFKMLSREGPSIQWSRSDNLLHIRVII